MTMLDSSFFNQEPIDLARELIGKVLRHRVAHPVMGRIWLSAQIIETEAYYLSEKGSHSSLGFTEKRKAMFMAPGTIYMYYARGGDSINFSARGEGNGVLVKSAIPHVDKRSPVSSIDVMHERNPVNGRKRETMRLCSGQTLLCKSLGLRVTEWNQQQLKKHRFIVDDVGYTPEEIIQCRRLGIPKGRDEHLPYRFVDQQHAVFSTRNPVSRRSTGA